MRLGCLRMTNFRQHADTVIEFDDGLTGIIGPNGAGKSTILEAIAWALYGGDTARGGKDTIRFARAKARSPVRVELEFELASHKYRVVRELARAELYLDGGDAPIANSAREVGEHLYRRLGMSRAEFFNTYFTGQKELTVMASLTAPERAQFLSRVLGYEKLRAAQDLADERRKELRGEIAGIRSSMPDAALVREQIAEFEGKVSAAKGQLADAEIERSRVQAQVDALAPRWAVAQAKREEVQRIEGDLRVAESELGGLERNIERVTAELQQVAIARATLTPLALQLVPFHDIGNDLGRMRDLAAHDGRRQALLEQQVALTSELEELSEQRARAALAPGLEEQVTVELEAKRRVHEDVLGELELRRTAWVRDRPEAETRRNALRAQYVELKDQRDKLVALGEEGMCPTCQRPLGDHYREVLDLLDGQLETVQADGSYFKSRLEQLDTMPDEVATLDERRRAAQLEVGGLERRLARVQMSVQQLEQLSREVGGKEQRRALLAKELAEIPGGYDRAQHTQLEGRFEQLATLNAQANRLNTQVEREPALRREHENQLRTQAALTSRRAELEQRRVTTAMPEAEFMALRDQQAASGAALHAATLGAMNANTEAVLAQAALDRASASMDDLQRTGRRLDALEAEKRLHDELHRAYSDLRTDLNFAMRPELSKLASAFLSELTDSRYTELELDEKYRIVVFEEGVPKPVISGGEEDLANLVLRLAISQMIAERSGQAFSLLVLDEIFGSLDDVRRQSVVALLRGLHDRFEQVVLITHIESVRDGLDQVIEIGYDEASGVATVRRSSATTVLAHVDDTATALAGGHADATADATADRES